MSAPPRFSFEYYAERLSSYGLSLDDLEFFKRNGKPLCDVLLELDSLSDQAAGVEVIASATVENGFLDRITREEAKIYLKAFHESIHDRTFAFVVPAAGAASRQFQLLRTLLYHEELAGVSSVEAISQRARQIVAEIDKKEDPSPQEQATRSVLKEVSESFGRFWNAGIAQGGYAFLDDLRSVMAASGEDLQHCIEQGQVRKVVRYLLEEQGLNYGALPKVLMRFHRYKCRDGTTDNRLALEEHLRVGAQLFEGAAAVRMHFILSEEHEGLFQQALEQIRKKPSFLNHLQKHSFSVEDLQVSWDFQVAATDSVALDQGSGQIARDTSGDPLLRKAGHGALLPNLAALDVDGIWLQNVDNVLYDVPEIRGLVVAYKKIMAGLALRTQFEAGGYIRSLKDAFSETAISETLLQTCRQFCRSKLLVDVPFDELAAVHSSAELAGLMARVLDRPLAIVGYVPLEAGQVGGGPFVIAQQLEAGLAVHKVNTVEGTEFVDGQSSQVFRSGKFFNPVNLFVLKRDVDGHRYDLLECQDSSRCFISSKTDSRGIPIRAYERPGLWNGALAKALQISIATPSNTFAAVKDCAGRESFLHPLHQPNFADPIFSELDRARGVVDQELEQFLLSLVKHPGSFQPQC